MLKVNVAASDGVGAINEDVVGYCATAAWVIDGATGVGEPLLDGGSDAAWLAVHADHLLRMFLAATPDIPTRDLLRSVMAACRDELARLAVRAADMPHRHPSAAFAMVRIVGGAVELVTLGDCRIAFGDGNEEPALFGTSTLEKFEARTIALASQILRKEPDISGDSLKERLLPQLQANRRMMNRPDGYWVLGTDPAAADHLDLRTIPARPGQEFAIASDGWLRLVELFAIATPRDLLQTRSVTDLDRWRHRLRATEAEPRSRGLYPRVKIHDDASFVQCEIA